MIDLSAAMFQAILQNGIFACRCALRTSGTVSDRLLRPLPALLSVVWLGAGLAACGGARGVTRSSTSHVITVAEHVLRLSREFGRIDADDYPVLSFGRAATAMESKKITALLKRYYAVAGAGKGAKACSMLYEATAKEVVVEQDDWGVRGGTCPVVMSRIFRQRHWQLVADADSLKVVRVRTDGLNGRAVLRFGRMVESRTIDTRFVGGIWKVQRPLDTPMP